MARPFEDLPECCCRLGTESAPAHAAFNTYLAQGDDRSIRGVARELCKSGSLIGRWSTRFDWVRRAASYDRYLTERRRHEREDALIDLERRHAEALASGRDALMQPVEAFLEEIHQARERGIDPFEEVSLAELLRLALASVRHLPALVQAERLIAGISTVNVEAHVANSTVEARRRADTMTREELDAYLAGIDDGGREPLRGVPGL